MITVRFINDYFNNNLSGCLSKVEDGDSNSSDTDLVK
jgi:hypothetical protein